MTDAAVADRRRCRGDRGTTFVAAMVVMFTVTGAAAIFLARDVNQRVSDRSALQSVAFQSARAGAQQIDVPRLRSGDRPVVDPDRAAVASREAAARLGGQYGLEVTIERLGADGDRRMWTVVLTAPTRDGAEVVRAIGVARVEAGG